LAERLLGVPFFGVNVGQDVENVEVARIEVGELMVFLESAVPVAPLVIRVCGFNEALVAEQWA
jgi:hypothetical protein